MLCGAAPGSIQNSEVITYAELWRTLMPIAVNLDGDTTFSDEEKSLLNTTLMEADKDAPDVFTRAEAIEAARLFALYSMAVITSMAAIRPNESKGKTTIIDFFDKAVYVRVGARFRDVKDYLERNLGVHANVQLHFDEEHSASPSFQFFTIVSGCTDDNGTAIVIQPKVFSTRELAWGLYKNLPSETQRKFAWPKNCKLKLEMSGNGKLYILAYRSLPGNRVMFAGKVEVPVSVLRSFATNQFGPGASG